MPVNMSIKAVPDALMEKLRKRAEKNHRSLQGELITILEESLDRPRSVSVDESIHRLRKVTLKTASESVKAVRDDRDRR